MPSRSAFTELAAIQQAVRAEYGGKDSYEGLDARSLIASDALPTRMVWEGALHNVFKGRIALGPANAGSGQASGFYARFDNVPMHACTRLVTADLGRGLFSVNVGGRVKGGRHGTPPFTEAEAKEACSAEANAITWVFN